MASHDLSFLLSMMRSGKYSDFTMVCQGKSFKLHQVVVCPQSSVISAALGGNFKEATTKNIEIKSFDLPSAERMVEFLYSGTYSVKAEIAETESLEADTSENQSTSSQTSELSQQDGNSEESDVISELSGHSPETDGFETRSSCTPKEKGSLELLQDTLLCHLRTSIIADYYDIKELSQLARSNLQRVLQENWQAGLFTVIAKEAINSSGDQELHQIIKSLAVTHISELVELEEFADLDLFTDFGFEILRDSVVRMTKNHAQLLAKMDKAEEEFEIKSVVHKMELEEIKEEKTEQQDQNRHVIENIDACRKTLQDTAKCRHCQEPFHCYIESNLAIPVPSYTLRCSGCRCRH